MTKSTTRADALPHALDAMKKANDAIHAAGEKQIAKLAKTLTASAATAAPDAVCPLCGNKPPALPVPPFVPPTTAKAGKQTMTRAEFDKLGSRHKAAVAKAYKIID